MKRWLTALLVLSCAPRLKAPTEAPLFEAEAIRQLRGVSPASSLAAESCAGCHLKEHAAWVGTPHANALTNPLFVASLAREEKKAFCLNCHAPLPEQRTDASLAAEGVNCAVCHLRAGEILTGREPTADGLTAHPMRRDARLNGSEFCAACHQFNFPGTRVAMQNTLKESDGRACQSCHAPHAFPGAHSERLSSAVAVTVERQADGLRVHLAPAPMGHRFPTGDPFRRLRFELCAGPLPADEGRCVETAGHVFSRDAALQHGEVVGIAREGTLPAYGQTLRLPAAGAGWWRLEYRFAAPATEAELGSQVVSELARGAVPP